MENNMDKVLSYRKPANNQENSALLRLPLEMLLDILEDIVEKKGSLNVRISARRGFGPREPIINSRTEWIGYRKPFVHLSKEPCWTSLSLGRYKGFMDILPFLRTCQQAHFIGTKMLYTYPVFTFDDTAVAVPFFRQIPVQYRNMITTLKLPVKICGDIDICPWIDELMTGSLPSSSSSDEDSVSDFSDDDSSEGCPDDEPDKCPAMVTYTGPLDGEYVVGYDQEYGNWVQWIKSERDRFDDILLLLPGLKTLILEECPAILAPVCLMGKTQEDIHEQIQEETEELRKTQERLMHRFGPRLNVVVKEHRGQDAVARWKDASMREDEVWGFIGGLPLVKDSPWIHW